MRTSGHSLSTPLTDFDQLAAFFAGWSGRFEQHSAGRFEGRLSLVHGRAVRLVSVACNQTVLARGRDEPGVFKLYPVTPDNAGGLWQGRQLTPGQVVAHGPEADTNHVSARGFVSVGFSMLATDMEAAARALLGDEFTGLPPSWAALTPPADDYTGLTAQLHRAFDLALADPTVMSSAEGAQLEQECVRVVARGVAAAPAPRHRVPLNRRGAAVRRAEELMRANLHHPLGIVDLCAELGVSDRTLRLAFRELFGRGPMTHYRALRLNAVRAALKSPSTTVAEAAHRFGFHHLGNFAADFRRLFGHRPSETRTAATPTGG